MLKGDHTSRSPYIFEAFDYRATGRVEEFNDWDSVISVMYILRAMERPGSNDVSKGHL